jgi:hypothetical protein
MSDQGLYQDECGCIWRYGYMETSADERIVIRGCSRHPGPSSALNRIWLTVLKVVLGLLVLWVALGAVGGAMDRPSDCSGPGSGGTVCQSAP